ncbi:MAG TPA: DUF2357 domain-containing protein [Solirubrobacterales bacterium]|nr:DUF2357 domain-containing protein [Solirubrobacterales bacterium]
MTEVVARARCGRYEIVAQREGSLAVAADGAIELRAERTYLVILDEGADPAVLEGALSIPVGGREGRLRFVNFIGRAELGGRRLDVRSDRLDAGAVEAMLDEVSAWFSSLPFTSAGPVSGAYSSARRQSPRVLYHTFALLRDAFRGLGPHDLCEAFERILARPHESLRPGAPRLVPLGAASHIDSETLDSIVASPGLLRRVQPGSRLAGTAAARRLGGVLPEPVTTRPFLHSTDNPENRFVAGFADTMVDALVRFDRLARRTKTPAAATNAAEAREIADFLSRCRRHRVLADLEPLHEIPLRSAALRSRPGYRDLLRLYYELLGRLQVDDPHDAQRLLEVRNAADIYEHWCYVRVVDALERRLGPPTARDRFEASDYQAELRWGYRFSWPGVEALYNATFSRPASYSLSMRPDIVLRSAGGRLDLFDAKLKRRFAGAHEPSAEGDGDVTFKPEDLHKMHAYRDALGADSVWVLYPGNSAKGDRFAAPQPPGTADQGFRGVGAIALRPGAPEDGGLDELLVELIGNGAAAGA